MNVLQFGTNGFDYSTNQITEGFHLLDGRELSFLCTHKVIHHGSKLEKLHTIGEPEALSKAHDWADVIICSSGGDYNFLEGASGECFKNEELARKLVFIDGHDSNAFLVDPFKLRLYLKRELRYPEANSMVFTNVRSLTFGVYDFHMDWIGDKGRNRYDDKPIDVGFVAFGGSSPMREHCANALKEHFSNSLVLVDSGKQPLPLEDYWREMRRCKVIVSIQGAGLDTLRFWEAMGFGAVLCSVDVTRLMFVRNAPEPMRHALYFENFGNMIQLIQAVISNPARWSDMRNATDELIRCHHTTKARANQLLEMFKETSCPDNFSEVFAKA